MSPGFLLVLTNPHPIKIILWRPLGGEAYAINKVNKVAEVLEAFIVVWRRRLLQLYGRCQPS